jgi:hypothetical protein
LGWGDTECTWYIEHYSYVAYCTNPRLWMLMSVDQSAELELSRESEMLGQNLPQCKVYHKSHVTRPGIEPGRPFGEKTATNLLSYGTTLSTKITLPFI